MNESHPGINDSHPALHGGPPGPDPNGMLPVPGEYKAFILCFIYYAKDFNPSKSEEIDPNDCLAAVTDILKYQHSIDIQPDHILAYYGNALANANRSGRRTWDYAAVATSMAYQVHDAETVMRITSFELHRDAVAKLSPVGNEVLAHVRRLALTEHPPNHVRTKWTLLQIHPERRNPRLIDPVLLGKYIETPTFPSDTSSRLAAAANRTLEKSASNSPEGDAS